MQAETALSTERIHVPCCIAGGGPAGMMLGYLLARAGVQTVVLEKHADFLRDFRGDTVHPSTLRILDELGLLNLAIPGRGGRRQPARREAAPRGSHRSRARRRARP